MVAWFPLHCYPQRTYYLLINKLFNTAIFDQYNQLSFLLDLSTLQFSKHLLFHFPRDVSNQLTYVLLRYYLEELRPKETTN